MLVEFLLVIGILFIAILIGIIFFIPSESKQKKNKKKAAVEPSVSQGDWEQRVSRLENHIQSLRNQILDSVKKAKSDEKELMVERVKVKKLQEKLSQERQWHTKEQESIDKRSRELQQMKAELVNVQENFSKAHSLNLQLDHKVKDLEEQSKLLNDQRRLTEGENTQLKTKMDEHRKEIAHLKKENMELSKKKEDAQWIAKSEYERVVNLLKEKEKELDRSIRKPRE